MESTKPIILVGSGRSGTLALAQAFALSPLAEAHHEYLFENILRDAVLYFMKRVSEEEMRRLLSETHVAAVHYSRKPFWIDCSNALPWVIAPLSALLPEAKFVHVVRNGRRVVSSFCNKFTEIMYADDDVRTLRDWLEGRSALKPPPAKRYWRPIPLQGDPLYEDFALMNQFERLCWYWTTITLHADAALRALGPARKLTMQFEEVTTPEGLARLGEFIGLPFTPEMMQALRRPVNVHIPQTFALTADQERSFERLCSAAMKHFNYDSGADYQVEYHPKL